MNRLVVVALVIVALEATRFVVFRLVVVALVARKSKKLELVAVTESNTGFEVNEYVTLPRVSVATVKFE